MEGRRTNRASEYSSYSRDLSVTRHKKVQDIVSDIVGCITWSVALVVAFPACPDMVRQFLIR